MFDNFQIKKMNCVTLLLVILSLFFNFFLCCTSAENEQKWVRFCTNTHDSIIVDARRTGRGEIGPMHSIEPSSWRIFTDYKRNLGVKINVNFDHEDHFLVIQGDHEEITSPMIQFISGASQKTWKFEIPVVREFFLEFCPENAQEDLVSRISTVIEKNTALGNATVSASFFVEFERIEPRSSDIIFPEDPPESPGSYEVQFKGRAPKDFSIPEFLVPFIYLVDKIAKDYCLDRNITLTKPKVTVSEIVKIHLIRECPHEWKNGDNCSSVYHSIFVSPGELSTEHLREMWQQVNQSYLDKLQLSIFTLPGKSEVEALWLLYFGVPVIILAMAVPMALKVLKLLKEERYGNSSHTNMGNEIIKPRKSSLKLDKFQRLPSFIKVESKRRRKKSKEDKGYFEMGYMPYYASVIAKRVQQSEEYTNL